MSKGFWGRFVHFLLGSPSSTAKPSNRPKASASRLALPAGPEKQKALVRPPFMARTQEPPVMLTRYHCETLEVSDLCMIAPFLMETEKGRFIERVLPTVDHYAPWEPEDIPSDGWQRLCQWSDPIIIHDPWTMTIEGFCVLITAELMTGMITYRTPVTALPRSVRVLWLSHHGRRIEYVFRMFEEALGSRAEAMKYFWWIVSGL